MNLSTLQVAGAAICGACALLLVAAWWLAPRIRSALGSPLPLEGNDGPSCDVPVSATDSIDDFLLLIELQDRLIDKGHADVAHELDVLFPCLRWDLEEMEEVESEPEQEEVTS